MKTKPDLGIKNPYALDDKQFTAAVDLLKAQNANIGEYWSDYLKAQQAFNTGDTVIGTTWQIIANYVAGGQEGEGQGGAARARARPAGRTPGWSATKSKHKTCAYKWMDHIISPKVNAEVAEWFGEAPANSKSCAETADKTFCDTFHADDEAYFDQVWYWNTPIAQCLDGRTDVDLQGLRRLDDRLAGDQGLTRTRAGGRAVQLTRALRRPAPAPAAAAGAAAGGADAGAGRRVPRRARRPPALGVLVHRRLHRRHREVVHAGQLPGRRHQLDATAP